MTGRAEQLRDFNVELPIARACLTHGISTWAAALDNVAKLPYGRLAKRDDFLGVLEHGRGSCSLKHGLLALLAREQGIEAHLMIGLFEMDRQSVPDIRDALAPFGIEAVLEAHLVFSMETPSFRWERKWMVGMLIR